LAIVKDFKHLTDQNSVKEVKEYGTSMTSMQIDGVGNVGFFYTRLSDRRVSLKERRELAEKLGADLFLSVHINSTASGRESDINGGQVLYRAADPSGESKKFAGTVMRQLEKYLGCRSRGTIAGDDIYIVRTAKMPVALAEVGFITNKAERSKLASSDYQNRAAQALVDAVSEYLKK
ncbi:MAG: N-acetylmuramoyl-L-alanine amidase, partial [Candidatus Weimeria sp.]